MKEESEAPARHPSPARIPLRCQCGQCTLPFGYLVWTPAGYELQIEARHHGRIHTNHILLQGAVVQAKTDAPG